MGYKKTAEAHGAGTVAPRTRLRSGRCTGGSGNAIAIRNWKKPAGETLNLTQKRPDVPESVYMHAYGSVNKGQAVLNTRQCNTGNYTGKIFKK